MLVAMEFRDFLSARYDVTPQTLKKYDGCAQSLFVRHRLGCSNGGLVIARHKQVRDDLLYFA